MYYFLKCSFLVWLQFPLYTQVCKLANRCLDICSSIVATTVFLGDGKLMCTQPGAQILCNDFVRPFCLAHQAPIDLYIQHVGDALVRVASCRRST